ncbi:hypothetical protein BH24ACT3_BH24ACT3_04650 [soil metagenome]
MNAAWFRMTGLVGSAKVLLLTILGPSHAGIGVFAARRIARDAGRPFIALDVQCTIAGSRRCLFH